jgi:hypothetical protein
MSGSNGQSGSAPEDGGGFGPGGANGVGVVACGQAVVARGDDLRDGRLQTGHQKKERMKRLTAQRKLTREGEEGEEEEGRWTAAGEGRWRWRPSRGGWVSAAGLAYLRHTKGCAASWSGAIRPGGNGAGRAVGGGGGISAAAAQAATAGRSGSSTGGYSCYWCCHCC